MQQTVDTLSGILRAPWYHANSDELIRKAESWTQSTAKGIGRVYSEAVEAFRNSAEDSVFDPKHPETYVWCLLASYGMKFDAKRPVSLVVADLRLAETHARFGKHWRRRSDALEVVCRDWSNYCTTLLSAGKQAIDQHNHANTTRLEVSLQTASWEMLWSHELWTSIDIVKRTSWRFPSLGKTGDIAEVLAKPNSEYVDILSVSEGTMAECADMGRRLGKDALLRMSLEDSRTRSFLYAEKNLVEFNELKEQIAQFIRQLSTQKQAWADYHEMPYNPSALQATIDEYEGRLTSIAEIGPAVRKDRYEKDILDPLRKSIAIDARFFQDVKQSAASRERNEIHSPAMIGRADICTYYIGGYSLTHDAAFTRDTEGRLWALAQACKKRVVRMDLDVYEFAEKAVSGLQLGFDNFQSKMKRFAGMVREEKNKRDVNELLTRRRDVYAGARLFDVRQRLYAIFTEFQKSVENGEPMGPILLAFRDLRRDVRTPTRTPAAVAQIDEDEHTAYDAATAAESDMTGFADAWDSISDAIRKLEELSDTIDKLKTRQTTENEIIEEWYNSDFARRTASTIATRNDSTFQRIRPYLNVTSSTNRSLADYMEKCISHMTQIENLVFKATGIQAREWIDPLNMEHAMAAAFVGYDRNKWFGVLTLGIADGSTFNAPREVIPAPPAAAAAGAGESDEKKESRETLTEQQHNIQLLCALCAETRSYTTRQQTRRLFEDSATSFSALLHVSYMMLVTEFVLAKLKQLNHFPKVYLNADHRRRPRAPPRSG